MHVLLFGIAPPRIFLNLHCEGTTKEIQPPSSFGKNNYTSDPKNNSMFSFFMKLYKKLDFFLKVEI